jgi:LPS O-antigen subunit length determinant protein (WzzB/FepE family)
VKKNTTAKSPVGILVSSRYIPLAISFASAVSGDQQRWLSERRQPLPQQVQLETTEEMTEQAAVQQLSAQQQGQSERMSEQIAMRQQPTQ